MLVDRTPQETLHALAALQENPISLWFSAIVVLSAVGGALLGFWSLMLWCARKKYPHWKKTVRTLSVVGLVVGVAASVAGFRAGSSLHERRVTTEQARAAALQNLQDTYRVSNVRIFDQDTFRHQLSSSYDEGPVVAPRVRLVLPNGSVAHYLAVLHDGSVRLVQISDGKEAPSPRRLLRDSAA